MHQHPADKQRCHITDTIRHAGALARLATRARTLALTTFCASSMSQWAISCWCSGASIAAAKIASCDHALSLVTFVSDLRLRRERGAHASICAKIHIAHLAFAMQVAMVHRDSLLLSRTRATARRHASMSSSAKAKTEQHGREPSVTWTRLSQCCGITRASDSTRSSTRSARAAETAGHMALCQTLSEL